MNSINETRDAAFDLVSQNFEGGEMPHTSYSSIYIAPTSNVTGVMNLYHDYDKVLSVGGMGALGYEASLHGAKVVDLFDINELQRLYYIYFQTH